MEKHKQNREKINKLELLEKDDGYDAKIFENNIKYIFKDVDENYFNSFHEIDLHGKTDIAQMKNFYYYNNLKIIKLCQVYIKSKPNF